MKITTNRIIIACMCIFAMPILISSHNLYLSYKINRIQNEIKQIKSENQYLNKNYSSRTTLIKINKLAMNMGFTTPEPYTIINMDEKKQNDNNTQTLLAKLNKILKNV